MCYTCEIIYEFLRDVTAEVDQDLSVVEFPRSHSDTPQSVGLLWTSDETGPETST
jgi:hypothetical protein